MFDSSLAPEPERARSLRRIFLAIAIVVPSLLVLLRLIRQPEAETSEREAENAAPRMTKPAMTAPVRTMPQAEAMTLRPVAESASIAAAPAGAVPLDDNPLREIIALARQLAASEVPPIPQSWYRVLRVVFAVLIIALPELMLFGLPSLMLPPQYSMPDYLPYWSDDIYYWRQDVSFATVGLDSGYFTYGEQPARIGTFYGWGIFVPMVQGTIGRVFGGMSLLSIPLMNAVMLSIGLAVFLLTIKPSIEQELWLIGGLLVFVPLWLSNLSTMSEVMHFATAALIAAVFYRLMTTAKLTWRQAAAGLLVVTAATLLRPMMSLLFIPLCLLLVHSKTWWKLLLGLLAGVVLGGFFTLVIMQTSAPYPFHDWRPILGALPNNPTQAVELALMNADKNLRSITQSEPAQLFQRGQFLVAVILLLALPLINRFWRREWYIPRLPAKETLLHLYILCSIVVFYILFYDMHDWRDFRGLSPYLLLSVLLFVAFRRRFWLAAFVISGALFLPLAQAEYINWAGAYLSPTRHAEYVEWQEELANVVTYEENAPSPWCNTVFHSVSFFKDSTALLTLPPQIAISFALGIPDLPDPPQSRYLMLDQGDYTNFADRFARLQPIMDVPGGTLFYNPDSACRTPLPPP